ncbi:hypothetical protein HQQ81_21170 [Microbacteriaceae bacterium VKM Ac-2854]|nr:hypothetical protein [Microbacteriaceae bacterium VKM Ac-2854]
MPFTSHEMLSYAIEQTGSTNWIGLVKDYYYGRFDNASYAAIMTWESETGNSFPATAAVSGAVQFYVNVRYEANNASDGFGSLSDGPFIRNDTVSGTMSWAAGRYYMPDYSEVIDAYDVEAKAKLAELEAILYPQWEAQIDWAEVGLGTVRDPYQWTATYTAALSFASTPFAIQPDFTGLGTPPTIVYDINNFPWTAG